MKQLPIVFVMLLLGFGCAGGEKNQEAPQKASTIESQHEGKATTEVISFSRVSEPRENAFSLLIPKGWQTEGGIFRVDPTAQGGPAQSIAAKLDFAVKKDEAGTVMIRWLPDVLFFDMRMSPAGQMGMFPPGSSYRMWHFPMPIRRRAMCRLQNRRTCPSSHRNTSMGCRPYYHSLHSATTLHS